MAAPKKYSDELRERATRMAMEARKDPAGRTGAIRRIAEQLDVHPEALPGLIQSLGGHGNVQVAEVRRSGGSRHEHNEAPVDGVTFPSRPARPELRCAASLPLSV